MTNILLGRNKETQIGGGKSYNLTYFPQDEDYHRVDIYQDSFSIGSPENTGARIFVTTDDALQFCDAEAGAGNLGGIIPAGYYAKLRQITTGTASAAYNTGQEVLL